MLDRPERNNNKNYYEFGSSKTVAPAAQALQTRPWTVKIDGMVEKEQTVGIDDLIRKMTLESAYRQCVEAWLACRRFLAKLVELARPRSAKSQSGDRTADLS